MSLNLPLLNTIPFQEKLLLTKHLSIMIQAGITIADALAILVEQTSNTTFKKILEAVLFDVRSGRPLAYALGKHRKVFDQFYISIIEVGEESGTLQESLNFLAKQLSKEYQLRQKVRGALIYPGLVFSVTGIMGTFIAFFILPKLVDFFDSFEVELPMSTKILLFIATSMKEHGVIIGVGLILLITIFLTLLRIPAGKYLWHRYILITPIFGKLLKYSQLSRFSRNLGVLLSSGIPIVRGIHITALTMSNLTYSQHLLEIEEEIAKGKNLYLTMMNKRYHEFPPIVIKMINIGEETGKLDETLMYLADFYEEEIDEISKNLTTILEPILLLIIGTSVGFVAVAIISPIYELTGSIK